MSKLDSFVSTLSKPLGLEITIRRTGGLQRSMPTSQERLEHAKRLGFAPRVIFDGGAFQGQWSKAVVRIFPGAQLVLMEPNPFVQEILRSNVSNLRPSPVVLEVALGDLPGSASLNLWRDETSDTGASLLAHVRGKPRTTVPVAVETLDGISERLGLLPDLIKLDLQGAELLAIRGGDRVFRHAEFAVIEFGCLQAYIGRATPRDLVEAMYERGYGLYDIVDCHYRPHDGALTGGDFFFVKDDSALRAYKGWE